MGVAVSTDTTDAEHRDGTAPSSTTPLAYVNGNDGGAKAGSGDNYHHGNGTGTGAGNDHEVLAAFDPSFPEAWHDDFHGFDINRDGKVELWEVRERLALLGSGEGDKTDDELRELIAAYNTEDRDGAIDFPEYVAKMVLTLARSPTPDERHCETKEAFRAADVNGDGVVDRAEFDSVMQRMAAPAVLREEEVDVMFRGADVNNNGVIDYNEFLRVCLLWDAADAAEQTEHRLPS